MNILDEFDEDIILCVFLGVYSLFEVFLFIPQA